LPACTASNLDDKADDAAIDRQVKSLAHEGNSIYKLDAARLRDVRPDLIIAQAQCEVCAVSLKEINEALAGWPGPMPQIVLLAPARLAEIWEDIRKVAEALQMEQEGRSLLRSLKERVVNILEKTCARKSRPSVACLEWIEPLMGAGNWIPELVELAGGVSSAGNSGKHSGWLSWESLAEGDPDIIVAMPCGFDLARTQAAMKSLSARAQWTELRAVRKNAVYVTDGNQFFNRPGPRIVESLEILAEIIHPEWFNFGFRGKAWEPWR